MAHDVFAPETFSVEARFHRYGVNGWRIDLAVRSKSAASFNVLPIGSGRAGEHVPDSVGAELAAEVLELLGQGLDMCNGD